MGKKKQFFYLFIFLFIFGFGFFLRFWKISDNFTFDIDTQYQALLAKTIIEHFHIIWIGVSASSIGYYLGPGLVYVTAFLLWLSKGDPIILGYFASFIGLITSLSLYYIAKKLYGQKVAVISLIIYGFSAFIIGYDRRYWPIFVPLIALWQYYSLVMARNNTRWLIVTVFLMALSYHIHLSLFIFWPFILWSFIKLFKKIDLFTWGTSIATFIIITLPLLVFDFVHNFDNLLAPIKFISSVLHKSSPGINLHLNYLLSSLGKVFFINAESNSYLSVLLKVLLIIIFVYLALLKKDLQTNMLSAIVFLFALFFSLYPGYIQEYYLVFIFPFLAISCGLILRSIRPSLLVLLLTVFVIINLPLFLFTKNCCDLAVKKDLVTKVIQNIHDDYYLSFDGNIDMEGWRYLFEAYGRLPSQSKADEMFGWIYAKKISLKTPKYTVFVSNSNSLKFDSLINKYQSGRYTGYVFMNK